MLFARTARPVGAGPASPGLLLSLRPAAPHGGSNRPADAAAEGRQGPLARRWRCAGQRLQQRRCAPQPPAAWGGAGGPPEEPRERTPLEQRDFDQKLILGMGLGLTGVIAAAVHFGGPLLLESGSWEGLQLGDGGSLGAGDLLGGLLWSVSLYFASPWQLLLLFLGKIETERPSDGVLRLLGQAGGLDVDAIDYQAPAWVRAGAWSVFVAAGFSMASVLGLYLGDASWSVSTGLGSLMAAGMYEVGRPRRLSVEEAQLLERQYVDFAAFADEKLQRSGRCHETDVIRGFRRTFGRYRQPSAISDATIRDMIRNWHPQAERSGQGFYKNLSFRPYEPEREAAAAAAASAREAAERPAVGRGSAGGS